MRASTIIQRWENSFAIQSTKQTLTAFACTTVALLHWVACLFALLANLQMPQRFGTDGLHLTELEANLLTLMESDSGCTGCLPSDPSTQAICDQRCLTACERTALASMRAQPEGYVFYTEPWTCRAAANGYITPEFEDTPFSVYVAGLLVAMLQLVGGVATIGPTNYYEYAFFFVSILTGTVLLAAVQGVICGVVTNGDPDEISWRQNLDALNFMMSDTSMPHDTRVSVRKFFRQSKRLFKRKSYDTLVSECLSDELQRDVRYQIAATVIQGVWWLRACEREFLVDLSVRVARVAYGPGDPIMAEGMLNVITHGMVSRGGVFLAVGDFFGDIILSSPVLRDTTRAKALCYCEIAVITREALFEALVPYPNSQRIIKQAAIKIALSRTMIIISIISNLIAKANKIAAARASRAANPKLDERRGALQHLKRQKTDSVMVDNQLNEMRAARAARRSILALTGGAADKTPDVVQVLQATFGSRLGGWREVGKDHKGRDVIIEPDGHLSRHKVHASFTTHSAHTSPSFARAARPSFTSAYIPPGGSPAGSTPEGSPGVAPPANFPPRPVVTTSVLPDGFTSGPQQQARLTPRRGGGWSARGLTRVVAPTDPSGGRGGNDASRDDASRELASRLQALELHIDTRMQRMEDSFSSLRTDLSSWMQRASSPSHSAVGAKLVAAKRAQVAARARAGRIGSPAVARAAPPPLPSGSSPPPLPERVGSGPPPLPVSGGAGGRQDEFFAMDAVTREPVKDGPQRAHTRSASNAASAPGSAPASDPVAVALGDFASPVRGVGGGGGSGGTASTRSAATASNASPLASTNTDTSSFEA